MAGYAFPSVWQASPTQERSELKRVFGKLLRGAFPLALSRGSRRRRHWHAPVQAAQPISKKPYPDQASVMRDSLEKAGRPEHRNDDEFALVLNVYDD